MNKAVSLLKVIVKVILWAVIGFVMLFIIIALIIQIPAIQTKLSRYATSLISSKTHTRVELKHISISFPKSVVIDGIYLEDAKKDTLLYAGETKLNIAFTGLFHNSINISSLSLEGVTLNLNSSTTDSLFNYNFLLKAFSDTTLPKITEPEKKSKWTFSIDRVSLENIRLHYNDVYAGRNVMATLKHLKLSMNRLDLANSVYNIGELIIENLNANVRINKPVKIASSKSSGALPRIMANKIQINDTHIIYADSVGKQSLIASITGFTLKDADIDLKNQKVAIDNLSLSKSNIHYNKKDNVAADTAVVATTEKSDWVVSVKRIDLDDNSVAYNVDNRAVIKNAFDYNHIDYRHLSLEAKHIYYSAVKTQASIIKFTAVDKNKYFIQHFETEFTMDPHSVMANKLKIRTTHSVIDADLKARYTSLRSLKDSLQFLILDIAIQKANILNSDITYFNPTLTKQSFFKNGFNMTSVSGKIYGPVNNLRGNNLLIRTGANTVISSDFIISGLPDAKNANFNFPNLKINSGKKDIVMMAGPSIPGNLELPENISLQVVFKGTIKSFFATMGMNSSFGAANLTATVDKNENFSSKATLTKFDLGSLLKNKAMYGPLSLTAEMNGHGLDKNTLKAKIKAVVSQINLNKYTYHNLKIDGNITAQEFEGKINLNDVNAVFDFDGLVNFSPDKGQYKFRLDLQGADLQKLNLSKDDIRIGLTLVTDLKGGAANKLNGFATITKVVVTNDGKQYPLDSVSITSVNIPGNSKLNVRSALVDIKYTGIQSPFDLPDELSSFVNNYFPVSVVKPASKTKMQSFSFEIQLRSHPLLKGVVIPELKEFQPGLITGSYDSQKKQLKLNAGMNKIVYGTTVMKGLAVNINSDEHAINYAISSSNISNAQINLDNFLVDGKLADQKIFASVSSIDENKHKKLLIRSLIGKVEDTYKLSLDPKGFYLMNERWNVADDNYIEFGKQGMLIHHLFIGNSGSQVNIASVHDKFNDDLSIGIKNFNLEDISGIVEKDTSLVKGTVNGNVLLKRVNNAYGIIADAKISNLFFRNVPIGNLSLKADNPTTEKFNIDINLSGADNNLTANGYFIPKGGANSVNIKTLITSLSLKTIEAFSMGQITEASGNLNGNISVEGNTDSPNITGAVTFNDAFIKPAYLNNLLQFKHETVELRKDGVYFNSFTILDADQHKAIINGAVKMENFKNFIFALNVNTQDFLLFNTSARDNKQFYGRMIIDSKIDINGPISLPVVNAKVKMKKGSNFTFSVPEKELTTYKGEDIVEFNDSAKLNQILYRDQKKVAQKSELKGFDISSIIEVDKQATLRLLMDPTSTDSLVVKGEAALNFTMDRSGKMSLTGAYNLDAGSYLVTLESVIKRKFDINAGSTIIWNGDPMKADIAINAIYTVRASPIDLVIDQMVVLSETDRNTYKQRYPFLVFLKLRGEILQPEISFEIQLRPEDKGILGGAVNAKLNLLNEDPSALNKQVFALLVLGRFIQENPLQTESAGGAETVVRTTVGKFLSAQLNKLSSKMLPGVELNFDIQSYDDYTSGQAQGRTQVDIGLKKQLFNERLSVQVGGSVDVEGAKAKQNSASDITGDVTVEYKLSKDGQYRLKGFRYNQYEGAIEGQLVETGVGILYLHDFDKWKEFFKAQKKKSDSSK